MNRWRVLQLADSAFPSGAFAHSSGIEAAFRCGQIARHADLDAFIDGVVWQAGHAALPFVSAAFDGPERITELDRACDATLVSHVANRASRAQGRAWVASCAKAFPSPDVVAIDDGCRERKLLLHLAPAFGTTARLLGLERGEALSLHLFGALRTATSASVRLGLVGPHEAQRMMAERTTLLDCVLATCENISPDRAAQASPLLDLFGTRHDDLDAKMFVS